MVDIVESITIGFLEAMHIVNLTAGDILQEPIPVPAQKLIKPRPTKDWNKFNLRVLMQDNVGQNWKLLR